jgi:branched-chain amino acid transport system ATP-binding protein
LLAGLKRADSGRVLLFGEDVTQFSPWRRVRRGLGRSFQVSSVFSSFTALENVQQGLLLVHRQAWRMVGAALRTHRFEAETLLEQVGLADRMNRLASELSYGDQRALELAVTLSSKPRILLLDEPTAGMGVEETAECLRRVKAITAAQDIPVLFVEHDMSVVFSYATRVVVLVAGQILVDGKPEEVRADQRVRDAYFGEAI